MTKEKLLNQEYQITAEIPLAFMRYLENRTDERVLEVVLVYNGVDRYDTIIDPTGMRSDPKIATVDYNHKRVNTGAYLTNIRVENNYKLDDGTILETALIGDIHIPRDAEMFFMDKDGQKRSNGNLYDAVSKGQVRSVSVEFRPYKGKQITDTKTGITTYKEWDLIRLSLLDITPGQPYSSIKITRSFMQNTTRAWDGEKAKQALKTWATKEDPNASIYDEKGDKFVVDWKQYEKGFAYQDGVNSKLPIYEVSNGELKLNAEAVPLAMASLNGSRIPVEIPTDKIQSTYENLVSPYKELGIEDIPTLKRIMSIDEIKTALANGEISKEDLMLLCIPQDSAQNNVTEPQREITVEVETDNKELEGKTQQPQASGADQNQDGEISDEEMRSYIKEVKRMYSDPKMIKDKIDGLERMYSDIKNKVDDITKQPEQKELSDEEKEVLEAQEIAKRALNSNLSDEIPNKVKPEAGDAKRSLGWGEEIKGKTNERDIENFRYKILKQNNYL